MSTQEPSNPHALRTFSGLISAVQDGELHEDLSKAVKDLVADLQNHAQEHGGQPKGKTVITLDLKYADRMFELAGDFKVTAPPSPARRRTILYATPDNHLTRVNPRQMDLPLRQVESGFGAVKTV